jgi:ABC-type glycerol-3-phosphate transport system substrate-binding protein
MSYMSRRLFLLVCAAACVVFGLPLYAGSLQVTVNGGLYAQYNQQELSGLSHSIPDTDFLNSSDTSLTIGVSLFDLLPLFIDAWELKVADGEGRVLLSCDDEDIAEALPYLFISPQGRDVTIHIIGEVLEETSASVWVSWEGVDLLKAEISAFADLHDMYIDVLEVPKISTKLVQTHRAGAPVPDLVMVQSDYIYELSGQDIIQPLDYINMDAYNPKGVEAFILNGHRWAVPIYFDTQLIIARSDRLSSYGLNLPEMSTLGDFEHLLIGVKNSLGTVPIAWNLYSAYWLLPFQFGFGKERLVESDKQVIVHDEASRKALTYLLSLIDRGLVDPFERDAMFSKFVDGKTPLMLSSSYMIPELERLAVPFELLPFPGSHDGQGFSPLLDFKGLSIPKKSRHPIVAKRLIQYLGSRGVQQRFTAATSKIPAVSAAAVDIPHWEVFEKSIERGEVIPADAGYAVYKNIMWNMLRFIINRDVGVDEGLERAQSLITAQLADIHTDGNQGENDEQEVTDTADVDSRRSVFDWLRNLWK